MNPLALPQAAMLAVVSPQGPALVPLDTVAPPIERHIEAPVKTPDCLKKWRIINAAANVADVASTVYLVESGKGVEANFIPRMLFGKRPQWYELGALKAVNFGINEFIAQRALKRGDVKAACSAHKLGAIVTGGIVAWNLTVALK